MIPMAPLTLFVADGTVPPGSDDIIRFPGYRKVTGNEVELDFYSAGSIVPDYTSSEAVELQRLAHSSPASWLNAVGVFTLPSDVQEPIVRAITSGLSRFAPRLLAERMGHHPSVAGAYDYVQSTYATSGEVAIRMGVFHATPGQTTVTVDRKLGEKNGLHFDSWDGTSACDRWNSRVRISINLGPSDRWFLCSACSLRAWLQEVARQPDAELELRYRDWFLAENPPIYALRLRPGQGYIAATDALFHDGSSFWADNDNLCLHMRQHCRPPSGDYGDFFSLEHSATQS